MKTETKDCLKTAGNLPGPVVSGGVCCEVLRGIVIFIAYLGAALLSILVSGPFGGWSVIWLPYGVGLAAFLTYGMRACPAIGLAALSASLLELKWLETSLGASQVTLAMAGSLLAALTGPGLGAFLIRRCNSYSGNLYSESGATRFYLLGGLASGVVGTVLLTVSWIPAGVVPLSMTGFFLASQILARSLGAVAIAPILLLSRSSLNQPRVTQVLALLVPRLLSLGAVLAVLAYVSATSVGELHTVFQKAALRKFSHFEQQAAAHLESLKSVKSLWDSSKEVEDWEFRTFVERPLEQNPGFDCLIWSPVINVSEKEPLNRWLESGGKIPVGTVGEVPNDLISAFNADDLGNAGGKVLFPVVYAESRKGGTDFIGEDLSSRDEIAEAILMARDEKSPIATRPFNWQGETRVAILQWIDRESLDEEKPRENWIQDRPGLAVAIVDPLVMLSLSGDDPDEPPLELSLTDLGDKDALLDREDPGLEAAPDSELSDDQYGNLPPFLVLNPSGGNPSPISRDLMGRKFEFAGKVWLISAAAHLPVIMTNPPWSLVATQLACLILLALLGILLMSSMGRTNQIRNEVETRTAELADSQSRFNELADNVGEAFWITGPEGRDIDYLSPGFGKIWKLDPKEVEANPAAWRESIHEEDRHRYDELVESGGIKRDFDVEYRIVRPDGSIRWIRHRGFPVRSESGETIRIAGVADDTTDLKTAEIKLLAAKQAAEEASEVIEVFFRVSLDFLCVAGADGYFKRINQSLIDALGYTGDELLDRPFTEFVHPEDVAGTHRAVAQLAEGIPLIRFQNRYRDSSGRYLWLEWSAVFDAKRDLIFAAARDVTEQRKMEDELRRSNYELEQFAYIASHDLQEPLRLVTSFVQLLQRRFRGKLDGNADEYIRHIVEGNEKMRTLILGLLELSRVERNKHPFEAVKSAEALDSAIENLSVAITQSGATISREELPVVLADPAQLTRLFQNLISNAIKYAGTALPKISVKAVKSEGLWVFSVSDNGPGIEPVQRERVFQIFQRLHSQAEVPGTGIGLAVCSRIISRHGGNIWIEGSDSGGATFCFTLQPAQSVERRKNRVPATN